MKIILIIEYIYKTPLTSFRKYFAILKLCQHLMSVGGDNFCPFCKHLHVEKVNIPVFSASDFREIW